MKPLRLFAITYRDDFVLPNYIRRTARQARQDFGADWMESGDKDWRGGWRRAIKSGYRAVPVIVTPEAP